MPKTKCLGELCRCYRESALPLLDEHGKIRERRNDEHPNFSNIALTQFRISSVETRKLDFCEKCISNYGLLISEHAINTKQNKETKSIRQAEHSAALDTLNDVGAVRALLNWSFSKCIESYHEQNKNYSDTGEIIYGKKKLFKKEFKIQFTEILLQTKQVVYLMMLELLVLFTDGDYYSGTPKNGRELKLFIKNSNLPENSIVNFNHVIGAFNSLLNQFNKTAMREYKRIWITNATVCKKINDVDIVIPLPLTMDICMKIYLFLQRHR